MDLEKRMDSLRKVSSLYSRIGIGEQAKKDKMTNPNSEMVSGFPGGNIRIWSLVALLLEDKPRKKKAKPVKAKEKKYE